MINTGSCYLRNPDIAFVGTSAHYLFIQGGTRAPRHPMYGGLGTFWRDALGVMQTLVAAMNRHRLNNAPTRGSGTNASGPQIASAGPNKR